MRRVLELERLLRRYGAVGRHLTADWVSGRHGGKRLTEESHRVGFDILTLNKLLNLPEMKFPH